MTVSLIVFLFMLLPSSGVVSGGREFSFNTTEGLIPSSLWLYAQPFHRYDKSTFTELVYQDGYSRAFSVSSCGETAGVFPYISSKVYSDSYSAAFFLEDFAVFAVKDSTAFSYSAYYSDLTIDFRKTEIYPQHISLQYKSDNFLVAGAGNSVTASYKYNFTDYLSFGPAVLINHNSVEPWLSARAEINPVALSVFPAIDSGKAYQRMFATLTKDFFELSCGWNGEQYFDNISFTGDNFVANLSSSPLGIMFKYQPINSLLIVTSINENKSYQAEIQTEFFDILSGFSILHTTEEDIKLSVNVGINLNINTIQNTHFSEEAWWTKPATVR